MLLSRILLCAGTIAILFASSGCTDHFLQKNSARQVRSVSDLMYEQILDNIAMYECEPGSLPHFAIVGDGTTQVTDQASASPTLSWNPRTFVSAVLGLNGSHNVTENWKLQPVMSAGRLRRMRAAFDYVVHPRTYCVEEHYDADKTYVRIAENSSDSFLSGMISIQLLPNPTMLVEKTKRGTKVETDDCGIHFVNDDAGLARADAEAYLGKLTFELERNFPVGWYCTGGKCAALKSCSHRGHYNGQWAWVGCETAEALSRFTTTILAIASLDPPAAASPAVVSVSKYFYENGAWYELEWDEKRSKLNPCDPVGSQICPAGAVREALTFIASSTALKGASDERSAMSKLAEKSTFSLNDIRDAKRALDEVAKEQNPVDKVAKAGIERVRSTLNEAERAIQSSSSTAAEPSAFDRPGNSPFSRGGGGAEFVPNLDARP